MNFILTHIACEEGRASIVSSFSSSHNSNNSRHLIGRQYLGNKWMTKISGWVSDRTRNRTYLSRYVLASLYRVTYVKVMDRWFSSFNFFLRFLPSFNLINFDCDHMLLEISSLTYSNLSRQLLVFSFSG